MRRSTTALSSLKSGMPKRSRPPAASDFSNTVTAWPARQSCWAAARPAGPEPITATCLPVFFVAGSGLIQPFSQAVSTIAHSMDLMATASSLMLRVQAASQGAGQMRPVNSGKLLVECRMAIASRQLSL